MTEYSSFCASQLSRRGLIVLSLICDLMHEQYRVDHHRTLSFISLEPVLFRLDVSKVETLVQSACRFQHPPCPFEKLTAISSAAGDHGAAKCE